MHDVICVTTGNKRLNLQGAIIKVAFPSEILSLGNIKKPSWGKRLCSEMTTKLRKLPFWRAAAY